MKKRILQTAHELGFVLCRVTTAEPVSSQRLTRWLEQGCHGTMNYMARDPEKRCDPKRLLPEAKSVICCALAYGDDGVVLKSLSASPEPRSPSPGSIARFARGADYHVVVREKLEVLASTIRKCRPNVKIKCCVDTSPVLEKALAARAGIGWIGKHTLLVNSDFGSWFVLGEIITDVELEPDAPLENKCGACTACVDQCPTRALDGTSLNARKCVSYLTIECKDKHDSDSYGCDVCQEVCLYNAVKSEK